MKRNFIITLLLTFMMLFVTACGSDNNNKNHNANSKFEGTWIAYNKTNDKDDIQELVIENIDGQLLVSLYDYSYHPLMD